MISIFNIGKICRLVRTLFIALVLRMVLSVQQFRSFSVCVVVVCLSVTSTNTGNAATDCIDEKSHSDDQGQKTRDKYLSLVCVGGS